MEVVALEDRFADVDRGPAVAVAVLATAGTVPACRAATGAGMTAVGVMGVGWWTSTARAAGA